MKSYKRKRNQGTVVSLGRVFMVCFTEQQVSAYKELKAFIEEPELLYSGPADTIPDRVAQKICPVDPEALDYYQDALMVLYRGKDFGSEDHYLALISFIPKGTKYVVIYKPLQEDI